MSKKILIINLGSTSTKVAVYDDLVEVFKESITHTSEDLIEFSSMWDQIGFRKKLILTVLQNQDFNLDMFNAISCRGGTTKPVVGGIYILNPQMIADMKSEKWGSHPTNLGNVIAFELGTEYGIPVVTADLPVTDEFCPLARYSGIKEIPRISSFHALNQKRTARLIAGKLNKAYTDLNLIVVHMGGGISVAAHQRGNVIDVNNALDGDGPFSPERAGTVPSGDLIKLCFSGKYTETEMIKKVKGNGGLMSYLGTNSGLDVLNRIQEGDMQAHEVFEAMAYQISKEIGAAATVLSGSVDAIVLTGSLANSELLVGWIRQRVGFISPIHLSPGENETISLAENAMRYLTGEEEPKTY